MMMMTTMCVCQWRKGGWMQGFVDLRSPRVHCHSKTVLNYRIYALGQTHRIKMHRFRPPHLIPCHVLVPLANILQFRKSDALFLCPNNYPSALHCPSPRPCRGWCSRRDALMERWAWVVSMMMKRHINTGPTRVVV